MYVDELLGKHRASNRTARRVLVFRTINKLTNMGLARYGISICTIWSFSALLSFVREFVGLIKL